MPIIPIDKEAIWACGCGGKTFHMMMDGGLECRSCGKIEAQAKWKFLQTSDSIKIPYGAWTLDGFWLPNEKLDMSTKQQYIANTHAGFPCNPHPSVKL